LGVIFLFTYVEKSSREQNKYKDFITVRTFAIFIFSARKNYNVLQGILKHKIRGGGDKG